MSEVHLLKVTLLSVGDGAILGLLLLLVSLLLMLVLLLLLLLSLHCSEYGSVCLWIDIRHVHS